MANVIEVNFIIDAIEQVISKTDFRVYPILTVIIDGKENPDEMSYLRALKKKGEQYNIEVQEIIAPTSSDVSRAIFTAQSTIGVYGILILSSYGELEDKALHDLIPARLDIDCVSSVALGLLMNDNSAVSFRRAPSAAAAAFKILDYYNVPLEGANIVIVGRSLRVGRPLAEILIQNGATVTVCNSHTQNLKGYTKNADIVITAIGKPHFFSGDYFSENQVIIDVGINELDGSIVGDVDFEEACAAIGEYGYITPVPGGVGKLATVLTFAKVCRNALSYTGAEVGI